MSRVLISEGHTQDWFESLKESLEEKNHSIDLIEDQSQLQGMLEKDYYSSIIVNMHNPNKDTLTNLQVVKSKFPSTNIILISDEFSELNFDQISDEEIKELGLSNLFTPPINTELILEEIEKSEFFENW